MNSKKYFEIDSTYRNRTIDRDPGDFTLVVSELTIKNASDALDPVSDSAPSIEWISRVPTGAKTSGNNNTQTLIQISIPINVDNPAETTNDYYKGRLILVNKRNEPDPADQPDQGIKRIIKWEFTSRDVSNLFFTVTLDTPLRFIPEKLGDVRILNTDDFSTGSVFVPLGSNANNYYVGYYIQNEIQGISRKIISYDGKNRIAGYDADPNWNEGDSFNIRASLPIFSGQMTEDANGASSYKVDPESSILIGDFIRFKFDNVGKDNVMGKTGRIFAYTGEGKPPFAGDANNPPTPGIPANVILTDLVLNPPQSFTGNTIDNRPRNYEILSFSRDNAIPFNFISTTSQSKILTYEIELINLTLPNLILKNGGRISFYPYVHVYLQNVSSSYSNRNTISSNNPNASRMLFRAAIDDLPNPTVSPFVKISGRGIVQTVIFEPNENFQFGVYLPNGDLFETVVSDNFSPKEPNPLCQVSALFSIKKL
jgi:hypothetical protein